MGKIIYEKTYPRIDVDQLLAELKLAEGDGAKDKAPQPSFDEYMREAYRKRAYILMPERLESAARFVDRAIKLSTEYELDIVIEDCDIFISVDLYLDSGTGMTYLRELMRYGDDI